MHRDKVESHMSNALKPKADGTEKEGPQVLLKVQTTAAMSRDGAPAAPQNPSPTHPNPPPFNPMQSSQSGHVHSVVPDLMRVYESLTNVNPHAQEGQQQQQPPQQPPPQQKPSQSQPSQLQPPGTLNETAYYQELPEKPSQHVNYAYITSEEQYRQIYQHQGQEPSSLPYIPAPSNGQKTEPETSQEAIKPEESTSTSKPSRSLRRKRSSISQQPADQDGSSSTTGKTKGRKKAKETDGRWSKRFTWPEELHRDFVSAVFDVGLKHSSPSTILEQMPKHPQITSERIKSHLQKYRVHRTKSKQEFMSSYEVTLQKFKSGEMDTAKSLSNGEAAAYLTQAAIMDTGDPSAIGPNNSRAASAKGNLVEGKGQDLHQKNPGPQTTAPAPCTVPPPPGHEALMLPKLTEEEKASPIGASMGYLLGLFFSLKKQLLVQRSSETSASVAPAMPPVSTSTSTQASVAAVYNSFTGTSITAPTTSGGSVGAGGVHGANPIENPAVMSAISRDWSSGGHPHPGTHAAALAVPGAPPGASPAVSNIEATGMMKREMENQMAFQTKMRALKQQELNKYKHITPNPSSTAVGDTGTNQTVRFKEAEPPATTPYGDDSHHFNQVANRDQSAAPTDGAGTSLQPPHSTAHQLHHRQQHQGEGDNKEMHHDGSTGAAQGAGETADATRARAPSFSMGGNDEFWNGDVMDEQLFEFLMNN
ncbi:expressed unknown protein [Seminavis robusta]|uniref:Uncharacterized protein n=1 Tax=Seminavis robusta TaxID=568900 RepID=A0A9N8DNS7_9STRA|nr:expressed unknown protein [Seminavis robusta]|eukprot:Sro182_g079380.1 n/a (704) ;mRNA; r:55725-57836